ncbi:MAG TPA: universal stress protein, partial [Solirubrobacteraceae bacterium]|nr:universal stress protein [Solirubrobacteraceae bacterium]
IARIGVGYNGSPESEQALAAARALAAELEARLAVLEAVEIPAFAFMAAGMPVTNDLVEDMVDEARRRVSALPGVEPHAAYGRPCEELAQFSASVDLLVVGSRGYGPRGRLVHGSTTSVLAGTARCPLMVLTRDTAPRLAGSERPGASTFGDQSAWVSATLAQR